MERDSKMRVDGNDPVHAKSMLDRVKDINKTQNTEKTGGAQKDDAAMDKISRSGKANEISELKSLIERLPEIRTDRVQGLKRAIDTGNYDIYSLRVAEKILQEL